jgi:hypothetical protein
MDAFKLAFEIALGVEAVLIVGAVIIAAIFASPPPGRG